MTYVNGVNLLPATGEFTYDTVAYRGQRAQPPGRAAADQHLRKSGCISYPDMELSVDQLSPPSPAAPPSPSFARWFFNSDTCRRLPNLSLDDVCQQSAGNRSIANAFQFWNGVEWANDHWRVSGLTETSVYLIPISRINGSYAYGGTPSDQSIVRCIEYLKSRGLRVVFYPFLLGDIPGSYPWRGRIAYSPDLSVSGPAPRRGGQRGIDISRVGRGQPVQPRFQSIYRLIFRRP